MEIKTKIMKRNIIIIILIILLIVLGVSFFYYVEHAKNNIDNAKISTINNSFEGNNTQDRQADGAKNQTLEQKTVTTIKSNTIFNNIVGNNQSPQIEQDLIYTTKVGIKIPYPTNYNFFVKKPNMWWPEIEEIQFGFEENVENVSVTPSSSKYYKQNVCLDAADGVQYSITKINDYSLYRIRNSVTTENFCLQTSEYTFMLNRNLSNKIKIDVGKIIFP